MIAGRTCWPAWRSRRSAITGCIQRTRSSAWTEVKRRPDVVGIFRDEESILRQIRAVLFARNDDRQSQHRDLQVETFTLLDTTQIDPLLGISTEGRLTDNLERPSRNLHRIDGRDRELQS